MSRFEVSYDPKAQAAYVRVSHKEVARTEEIIEDRAWMDFDPDGNAGGIEVICIEPGDLPKVVEGIDHALEAVRDHLGEDRKELLAL